MRRIARALVRDTHAADDLAQQTLATALRSPPDDAASPRAWLGTVLRNAVRKRQRAESRRARREQAVARRERLTSTVRDAEELSDAWRELWEDVRSLLERAREMSDR